MKDIDAVGELMRTNYKGGVVELVKGYLEGFLLCKHQSACVDMVDKYFVRAIQALGQTVIQFDHNICRDAYKICTDPLS